MHTKLDLLINGANLGDLLFAENSRKIVLGDTKSKSPSLSPRFRLPCERTTHPAAAARRPHRLKQFRGPGAISCYDWIHDFPAEKAYQTRGTCLCTSVAEFKGKHQTIAALALHNTSQTFEARPVTRAFTSFRPTLAPTPLLCPNTATRPAVKTGLDTNKRSEGV